MRTTIEMDHTFISSTPTLTPEEQALCDIFEALRLTANTRMHSFNHIRGNNLIFKEIAENSSDQRSQSAAEYTQTVAKNFHHSIVELFTNALTECIAAGYFKDLVTLCYKNQALFKLVTDPQLNAFWASVIKWDVVHRRPKNKKLFPHLTEYQDFIRNHHKLPTLKPELHQLQPRHDFEVLAGYLSFYSQGITHRSRLWMKEALDLSNQSGRYLSIKCPQTLEEFDEIINQWNDSHHAENILLILHPTLKEWRAYLKTAHPQEPFLEQRIGAHALRIITPSYLQQNQLTEWQQNHQAGSMLLVFDPQKKQLKAYLIKNSKKEIIKAAIDDHAILMRELTKIDTQNPTLENLNKIKKTIQRLKLFGPYTPIDPHPELISALTQINPKHITSGDRKTIKTLLKTYPLFIRHTQASRMAAAFALINKIVDYHQNLPQLLLLKSHCHILVNHYDTAYNILIDLYCREFNLSSMVPKNLADNEESLQKKITAWKKSHTPGNILILFDSHENSWKAYLIVNHKKECQVAFIDSQSPLGKKLEQIQPENAWHEHKRNLQVLIKTQQIFDCSKSRNTSINDSIILQRLIFICFQRKDSSGCMHWIEELQKLSDDLYDPLMLTAHLHSEITFAAIDTRQKAPRNYQQIKDAALLHYNRVKLKIKSASASQNRHLKLAMIAVIARSYDQSLKSDDDLIQAIQDILTNFSEDLSPGNLAISIRNYIIPVLERLYFDINEFKEKRKLQLKQRLAYYEGALERASNGINFIGVDELIQAYKIRIQEINDNLVDLEKTIPLAFKQLIAALKIKPKANHLQQHSEQLLLKIVKYSLTRLDDEWPSFVNAEITNKLNQFDYESSFHLEVGCFYREFFCLDLVADANLNWLRQIKTEILSETQFQQINQYIEKNLKITDGLFHTHLTSGATLKAIACYTIAEYFRRLLKKPPDHLKLPIGQIKKFVRKDELRCPNHILNYFSHQMVRFYNESLKFLIIAIKLKPHCKEIIHNANLQPTNMASGPEYIVTLDGERIERPNYSLEQLYEYLTRTVIKILIEEKILKNHNFLFLENTNVDDADQSNYPLDKLVELYLQHRKKNYLDREFSIELILKWANTEDQFFDLDNIEENFINERFLMRVGIEAHESEAPTLNRGEECVEPLLELS